MPFRRRNAKSRRRRPKARRRVDKVQDRRISRLEKAVEKKYAIRAPFEFRALADLVDFKSQIVALLPSSTQNFTAEGRIGNQISLKNLRCDYTIQSDAAMAVRVIFFWLTVPRTWSTTGTGAPPASTGVDPTWPQLLADFALDAYGGLPPNMNNIVAQHEMLTDSNLSPIIRLSDKVHYLGSPYNPPDDAGTASERNIKKLVFTKSYKDMKLTYNDVSANAAPVNRQLYMAVCTGCNTAILGVGDPTCTVTASVSMRYTDA